MVDIPSLEYWISPTPAYVAAGFAFAAIVGIFGLRDKFSTQTMAILWTLGCVLSLVAWLVSAKQEKDNAELKGAFTRVAESLKLGGGYSAKELADEILKRLPPKYPLTDAERHRLTTVLGAVPVAERFALEIYWPQFNGTRTHADQLAGAIREAGWQVIVKEAGLANAHGLVFAFSKAVEERKVGMPINATRLMALLGQANVPYAVGYVSNARDDEYAFIVGQPTASPN